VIPHARVRHRRCSARVPGPSSEEGAMETETAGWKWVLQGVVESAGWVVALCVLGTLTLSLIG